MRRSKIIVLQGDVAQTLTLQRYNSVYMHVKAAAMRTGRQAESSRSKPYTLIDLDIIIIRECVVSLGSKSIADPGRLTRFHFV
jgi:hypothetical protein